MAIVGLSPRLLSNSPLIFTGSSSDKLELELSIKENLLSINSLNKKNLIKPTLAPFNSLTQRPFQGKTNNVPGPGSYNSESLINKPKLYYLDEPYSLSKELRFKPIKKSQSGLGSYFLLNKPKPKQLSSGSAIKFHPCYNTHLDKRICSIPSKDCQYGYSLNDKGEISINEDPYQNRKHEGSKTNSVGPDQYQPQLKRDNHAVVWKRESNRIKKVIFPGEKDSNMVTPIDYSNENALSERTIVDKQKQFFDYMMKHRKEILNLSSARQKSNFVSHEAHLHKLSKAKPQKKEMSNDSQISASLAKTERCQHFGSRSDRYLVGNKETDTSNTPGPGAYLQLSHKKIRIVPLQSDIRQRNASFIPKPENDLGPGSYEVNTSSANPRFSSRVHFSSSQKRFPEENGFEVGPGSYDISADMNPRLKENKERPLLAYDRAYRKLNKSISQGLVKQQLEICPEYYDSLEYRIIAHMKRMKPDLAPFTSKSIRFKKQNSRKDNKINQGLISYSKDNPRGAGIPKVNHSPFLSSQRRECILGNGKSNHLGPGDYLHDSYFDKVKRSYNLRYV